MEKSVYFQFDIGFNILQIKSPFDATDASRRRGGSAIPPVAADLRSDAG